MNNNLFKNEQIEAIYNCLLTLLKDIGPFTQEFKKTSIHIVAGKGAFLGLHPKSDFLVLNIVTDHPLSGKKEVKVEQVSKSRYHNEVKISDNSDIDNELVDWIKEAYQLKTEQENK